MKMKTENRPNVGTKSLKNTETYSKTLQSLSGLRKETKISPPIAYDLYRGDALGAVSRD
jgi:hypothetical protein